MARGSCGHLEYAYDLTKWKEAKVFSGGSTEFWEDYKYLDKDDEKRIPVHPREMNDYAALKGMYCRDLYSKACCMEGDIYLDVIKAQDDLKFHFFYTGIDPEDGTDEPKNWLGLIIYDKKNLQGITTGLKKIGVDIASSTEDPIAKDTPDMAFQMMMRGTDSWVTFCDPWLKKIFSDKEGKLAKGTTYDFEGDVVKDLIAKK